jgi:integrase/recombinase XerC
VENLSYQMGVGKPFPAQAEASLAVTSSAPVASSSAGRLVEAFLSGRNERTIRAYSQDLEDFRSFTGASDMDSAARWLLSRGHGEANALALSYRTHLLDRALQPATVNRRLAALRSLVKLARTLGIVTFGLEIQNVKAEAYRDTRGPGLAGVRAMVRRLEGRNDDKGKRDLAILRLLYDLGLRRGEVVALDQEDVDLEGARLWVLGKGRSQKEALALPEETQRALECWREVRGDEPGPLFISFDRAAKSMRRLQGNGLWRVVKSLGNGVGIQTRPHGIRHTAVTEAIKTATASGMDLEEVRHFSRHRDIRTLTIYRDQERDTGGELAKLLASGV